MAIAFIYSPFPDSTSAQSAAQQLLQQKLVACVNILAGAHAHYIWQGAQAETQEVILVAKTTAACVADARAAIRKNHPYECPAILHWHVEANPEFAAWVHESVGNA